MSTRPIIRPYGDTTGDGMVQLSFTLPMPTPRSPTARPSSWPTRWAWTPRWSCTASRWATASPSSWSTAGSTTWSTRQGAGRRARLPAADAQGGERRDQALAAPPAGRRGRLHRHRRPHGRHRRDPQHQGLRRGEGSGVLPRDQGRQPRRPGLGAAAGRAARWPRRPTPSWSPRSSPSATPTCSTPARCPRRSARPTRPDRQPLLVVGGPRFDEAMAGELGVDRVFSRGTTPGDVASFLVHRVTGSPTRKAS